MDEQGRAASSSARTAGGRPLLAVALLLGVPLLVGPLLAPVVFNGLPAAAARLPFLAGLLDYDLARVTSRCVQLVALALLVPALRLSGLTGALREALAPEPARLGGALRAFGLAAAAMLGMYGVGWAAGAYAPDPTPSPVRVLLPLLPGALLVGLFEEILFRGFLFGGLRRRFPFWPAAIAASLFFAVVHFAVPEIPRGPRAAAGPMDGWALLTQLFNWFRWPKHGAFLTTLFLMGLALCAWYERRGHLWIAIGLHAGWVLAIGMGRWAFEREIVSGQPALRGLFGRNETFAESELAILVILPFLAAAFVPPRPRACGPAPPGGH